MGVLQAAAIDLGAVGWNQLCQQFCPEAGGPAGCTVIAAQQISRPGGQAQVPEVHGQLCRDVSKIEQPQSQVSVGQIFHQGEALWRIGGTAYPEGAPTGGVLVDGYQIRVQKQCFRRFGQGPKVTAQHQGRIHHGPEGKMGLVFLVAAAAGGNVLVAALTVHAHHQHIHIVVAAGAGEGLLVQLGPGDVPDGVPGIVDVLRGAEELRAGGADPPVNLLRSLLAGGEDNLPAAVGQRQPHSAVEGLVVQVLGLEAVVVLQIVHAPFRELAGVFKLVVQAAGVVGAGPGAAAAIHAEAEAHLVQGVGEPFHSVGELLRIRH